RHFRSRDEITAQFGPTREVYESVLAYLEHHGFTLVHGSANRLTLTVHGTRVRAEGAFGVHIGDFEAGGRRFFANDTDPAVPRHLASNVQAVMGLSNHAIVSAVNEYPSVLAESRKVALRSAQLLRIGLTLGFALLVLALLAFIAVLAVSGGAPPPIPP